KLFHFIVFLSMQGRLSAGTRSAYFALWLWAFSTKTTLQIYSHCLIDRNVFLPYDKHIIERSGMLLSGGLSAKVEAVCLGFCARRRFFGV
ncbi:MAG: hypothetical protein J6C43_01525, partial [Oscillospiraceae bacterium]|nr:hypothetical protein [Oscillospiraceae bacterium]